MHKPYNYSDRYHTKVGNILLFVVIAILAFASMIFLRSPKQQPPEIVKPNVEKITVHMNPDTLIDNLEKNASSWCKVSRSYPFYGNIQISSIESNKRQYEFVFLTDSLATKMAREFPNLFKFDNDDGKYTFEMDSSNDYVVVPVWLLKSLVENNVLKLPEKTD